MRLSRVSLSIIRRCGTVQPRTQSKAISPLFGGLKGVHPPRSYQAFLLPHTFTSMPVRDTRMEPTRAALQVLEHSLDLQPKVLLQIGRYFAPYIRKCAWTRAIRSLGLHFAGQLARAQVLACGILGPTGLRRSLRIPLQIDQWFHGKSTTDSTANRPVAPRQIDHLSWRAPTGGGGV